MNIFRRKFEVKPNHIGYLFKDNKFETEYLPGFYKIWDFKDICSLVSLPTTNKQLLITNQEVLTKDNVALRFSFIIVYSIKDGLKFLNSFSFNQKVAYTIAEAEERLYNIVQLYIRNVISQHESETLNEKRNELGSFVSEEMQKQVEPLGLSIEQAQIKDLTFPKSIQDLFAKHLEAKIRSKSELENARTAVATARALKNASELMKDDENIKFVQILETINKISEKGKHTFMIGDLTQFNKK